MHRLPWNYAEHSHAPMGITHFDFMPLLGQTLHFSFFIAKGIQTVKLSVYCWLSAAVLYGVGVTVLILKLSEDAGGALSCLNIN